MKNKTRIPLLEPDLGENELKYLSKCISDNWISSAGPFIEEFEKKIATYAECKFSVATANATSGLYLSLIVAGVKPGDYVIVPDWTFSATANAVLMAGAIPYFVDIDIKTWNIDVNLVEKVISKEGKKITAVIAVHALGHPADMYKLRKICDKFNVLVIEDAAAAIGSKYYGKSVGQFGDLGVFSFNGNKTLTAGAGGMIVTNSEKWAALAKKISSQGKMGDKYNYDTVGFNFKMSNLNAAVGLAQLERLGKMVRNKHTIAEQYDKAIHSRKDLVAMPRNSEAESNCWLYSVLTASNKDAKSLINYLNENGVEAKLFWESLSKQKLYEKYPKYLVGITDSIDQSLVSLPSSSNLSREALQYIISLIDSREGKPLEANL